MLPEWYLDSIPQEPAGVRPKARRKSSAVRRALVGLVEALAREMSGPVQSDCRLSRLEPRAKVAGCLVLVFGATLLNDLIPLAALLAGILILVLASGIGAARLARVWLGVPLFSLAIILPAATNLVTPGAPVLTLLHQGPGTKLGPWALPEAITITHSGLIVAGRFLLRSIACVTAAFLLIATTERAALLNGLRRLGMPRVFGMVLAMMQRYLCVLLQAAEQIHLAKLSRTIAGGSIRHEQRWVAAGIGSLFRRTHKLAEQTHEAMLSRGYDGDARVGGVQRLRFRDSVWLFSATALMAMLIVYDRLF